MACRKISDRDQAQQPVRAVIYARVSTREQEQDGYSIDAQLALLRDYAERNSLTVCREFVEAESAKVSNRPAFAQMLKIVKSEEIPVILVEKTDRLYRNLKDHVRVDDLDVPVHLVKEGEVISRDSKSHQKFVHGIKLLVSKNYSDNLSEEAGKGMAEKAKQGASGRPRLRSATSTLRWEAAESSSPIPIGTPIFSGFSNVMRRETFPSATLATKRRQRGSRPGKAARCRPTPFTRFFSTRRTSESSSGGDTETAGIHEPLIDKATFQKVQDIMNRRSATKAKPANQLDFLYKGLFFCGECGCQISAQLTKGHHYYACT